MLGHLVVVDYCSDGARNLVLAAQWSLLSPRTGLNFEQRLLGGIEQFAPLARSLLGKQRIAADDQALAGIVGRGDLGEVVLIEQGELDHARRDETGDMGTEIPARHYIMIPLQSLSRKTDGNFRLVAGKVWRIRQRRTRR